MRIVGFCGDSDWAALAGKAGAVSLDVFGLHRPMGHWVGFDSQNEIAARCSGWIDSVRLPGSRRTGVVGHFLARDVASGAGVLGSACDFLRGKDCDVAVGPMDGNTWRSYRLVTDPGTMPPFFLEPENPRHYPEAFEGAGFLVLARYYSSEVRDLGHVDPRLAAVAGRLAAAGVRIRPLDLAAFERDARGAFEVSLQAFGNAYLYTPIDETEFMISYEKIRPYLRPEFCLIAEEGEKCVGFVMSVPDMLQAKRGVPIDTLVVKTLAVLPGREYAGLGALLVERVQHAAKAAGYRRGIHALMHESNKSRNISGRDPEIRQYALFSRPL